MSQVIDMTGWVMSEHGVPDSKLTVIQRVENNTSGQARWVCECSCKEHNRIVVIGTNIRNGNTLSCGCLLKETILSIHKKYNTYDLSGEYGIGWTSNTQREFYFDLEDYDKIKDYCWYENFSKRMPVLVTHIHDKLITMHILLGYKNYDHIDRNELNNRRCNLRPATSSQNSMNHSLSTRNTSGVIGVYWKKNRQKWEARIAYEHNIVCLGYFSNKDEAIRARLEAEVKYFGEFAPQQHLYKQYGIRDTIQKEGDINEM